MSPTATAPVKDVHQVEDLIGRTPLVRLGRFEHPAGSPRVLAKLEWFNLGGSAKDRPAQRMLDMAMARGLLPPGGTVVESSSGNLGVALAQQCARRRLRFICVVDPRANPSTVRLIEAYGATVHRVTAPDPDTEDWLAARLAAVRDLVDSTPGAWWPDQYGNADNAAAHAQGTMAEVLDDVGEDLSAVLVATSTTGTVVGCQDALKARGVQAHVVAVDAAGSVLFGGTRGTRLLPGIGAGVVPHLSVRARPDTVVRVDDLDCVVGCRAVLAAEGMLVGASAGGVVHAFQQLRGLFGPSDTVALIMHDGGERYVDTVYDNEWVESRLGESRSGLDARVIALLEGTGTPVSTTWAGA